ncbi:chemotaxis protein CheW [Metabacillus fastidiosus]|uniref:Chemotaxis protein CheW n=1 Tax=Metabacillus fastidiosus TaxID=1458 RepID=A0ABU6NWL4_9BACI|nr:chemotaxis protein CheW [Metabacillus fastidiosus]MEC2076957.1 chemotaxis protein CheW [Metabacillus fastidiosus]MED4401509.1 chemotaxis protein CheW [Metabacillus fastidiosus]MED4452922.1 chemotaxis protein CheW [Metabacillus fastidiosus]MED4463143.1 chemotaxis protein CheW [Metabacillus fastidiosus]MED4532494.1 chemotaxis protein CheW [Metabacillus fastidiosus]
MSDITTTDVKVIVFQLKDEEYGIPVHLVRSIEKIEHITRVPKTAPFIKGVVNMRGVVTPIVELRKRFQIEEVEYTESTRIIIVSVKDIDVGLIVDSANDVIDIERDLIEPPPEVVDTIEAEYIKGVAKVGRRLIMMIDLETVLNPEEVSV